MVCYECVCGVIRNCMCVFLMDRGGDALLWCCAVPPLDGHKDSKRDEQNKKRKENNQRGRRTKEGRELDPSTLECVICDGASLFVLEQSRTETVRGGGKASTARAISFSLSLSHRLNLTFDPNAQYPVLSVSSLSS